MYQRSLNLDLSISDCELQVPEYKLFRQDRGPYGGGVCVYIKDVLEASIGKNF